MAEHVGKDPQAYAEEYSNFHKDLKSFHDSRGSSYSKLPHLHGHDVDLYLLYLLVTSRGGWEKVNSNGDWDNLLPYFGMHRLCANGAIALKQIYIRFLDLYERVHFHGEELDRRESELHEEDDARSRRRALRMLHATPHNYNLHQHFVSENLRRLNGLSTDNIQVSPAERIFLSLLCPLPNEQDFAVNVCSLLAMETRKSLPLLECPKIVDAILAHAGVFSQASLREHFFDSYRKLRGQNLEEFWRDVVSDADIFQLSEEDIIDTQDVNEIKNVNPVWSLYSTNSIPSKQDFYDYSQQQTDSLSLSHLNASADVNESSMTVEEDFMNHPNERNPSNIAVTAGSQSEVDLDREAITNSSFLEFRNGHLTNNLGKDENLSHESLQDNTISSALETAPLKCEIFPNEQSQDSTFIDHYKNIGETILEHQSDSQGSLLYGVDASTTQGLSQPESQLERKAFSKSKLPSAILKPDNPRALNYWLKQKKSNISRPLVSDKQCKPTFTTSEDCEIFRHGREMGFHNNLGQRVLQVLNIIRNLSFDETNITVLAQSEPCIRLLLLAAHAKWSCLPQLAFDAISNLAIEITLKDPANSTVSAILLETITRGLESDDRFVAMRCIETLGRLALKSENESLLLSAIEAPIFEKLCSFLTIPDVALLIYALECVYALSSLGQPTCDAFLNCSGALEVLISLLTVEAQSYGSKARILMNVVETVADGETFNTLGQINNNPRLTSTTTQSSILSPASPVLVQTSTASSSPLLLNKATSTQSFSRPSTPTQVKTSLSNAGQPDRENVAVNWLKAAYEPLVGATSIEQNTLFRNYIEACSKNSSKQTLGMTQFLSCVRSTFGQNVGPFRKQVGSNVEYYFEGMSPKSHITPIAVNPHTSEVVDSSNGDLPNSPILKAQLSAPPKSTSVKDNSKHAAGQISSTETNISSPASVNMSQPSSSIIKSLLANKVPESGSQNQGHMSKSIHLSSASTGMTNCMNSHVISAPVQNSPSSSNIQVAQRQQQQKLLQERENNLNSKNSLVISEKANGTNEVPLNFEPTPCENKPVSKGMLADLLERDLKKQGTNGVNKEPSKELRIGDKGLELVSKSIPNDTPPNDSRNDGSACTAKSNLIAQVDDSGHVQIHLEEETFSSSVCNGNSLLEQLEACEIESPESFVEANVDKCIKRPLGRLPDDESSAKKKAKQAPSDLTQNGLVPGKPEVCLSESENSKEDQSDQPNLVNGQISTGSSVNTTQQSLTVQPTQASMPNPVSSQPPRAFLILQPNTSSTPQGQRFMLAIQRPAGTLHRVTVPGNFVAIPTNQVLTNGNTINLANLGAQTTALTDTNNFNSFNVTHVTSGLNVKTGTGSVTTANPTGSSSVYNSSLALSSSGSCTNFPAIATQSSGNSSTTSIPTSNIEGVVTFSGGAVAFPARPDNNSRVPNMMESHVTITPVPASGSAISSNISVSMASPLSDSRQGNSNQDIAKLKMKLAARGTTTAESHLSIPTTTATASETSTYQFMCEWKECMRSFKTPNEVYNHACQAHCPSHLNEICCLWDHCDGLKRKRFSMMTHLMDRHCNDEMQKLQAVRRFQMSTQGKTDIPPPQAPVPHPGYAPHAAFHAIKRHAAESLSQKEYEEKEGPVTKSIRLTSALILRNISVFSANGRKCLQRYETHLASVALSNVESSRTVAQVLYELTQQRS